MVVLGVIVLGNGGGVGMVWRLLEIGLVVGVRILGWIAWVSVGLGLLLVANGIGGRTWWEAVALRCAEAA